MTAKKFSYKKASDIPVEIREALYGQELMRKLGIPSANLFVGINEGKIGVAVKLNGKVFGFAVAETSLTDDALSEIWAAAAKLWNQTCNSDPEWDFEGSAVRRRAVNIMAALSLAGIDFGVS